MERYKERDTITMHAKAHPAIRQDYTKRCDSVSAHEATPPVHPTILSPRTFKVSRPLEPPESWYCASSARNYQPAPDRGHHVQRANTLHQQLRNDSMRLSEQILQVPHSSLRPQNRRLEKPHRECRRNFTQILREITVTFGIATLSLITLCSDSLCFSYSSCSRSVSSLLRRCFLTFSLSSCLFPGYYLGSSLSWLSLSC